MADRLSRGGAVGGRAPAVGGRGWRLCDIPNPVMEQLYRLLDRTRWQELAGQYLHHSQDDIEFLEYKERQGFSPARHVLRQWKQEDPLVDELVIIFSRMRFYQAMTLIKEYASERLLVLLEQGEGGKNSVLEAMQQRLRDANKQQPRGRPVGFNGSGDVAAGRQTAGVGSTAAAGVSASLSGAMATAAAPPSPHVVPTPVQANFNLLGNISKEDMATKLDREDVAKLLDSRFNVSSSVAAGAQPATGSGPSVLGSGLQSNTCNLTRPQANVLAGLPLSPSLTPMHPARHQAAVVDAGGLQLPVLAAETGVKRRPSGGSITGDPTVDSYMDQLSNIPHISYKELEAGADGWSRERLLGSGGFGTVYRGTWKNTTWAVKRVTHAAVAGGLTDAERQAETRRTLEELRILNSCRHDNILSVGGYSINGPEQLLLYQLMSNGSLLDRLLLKGGTPALGWLLRLNIVRGAARGVQFLHTRADTPLIHGDIKSANILLDQHMEPKLGDFGLARELPPSRYTSLTVTRIHGTRPYLPDEYLRSRKLSEKVDTFSFGVVLFEVATGLPAYDDRRSVKLLRELVEQRLEEVPGGGGGDQWSLVDQKAGETDVDVFPSLLRFGQLCVHRRPKERPKMVDVLEGLDSVTRTRNIAARARSLSVNGPDEGSTSRGASPMELQALVDRRQREASQQTVSPASPCPQSPGHARFPSPTDQARVAGPTDNARGSGPLVSTSLNQLSGSLPRSADLEEVSQLPHITVTMPTPVASGSGLAPPPIPIGPVAPPIPCALPLISELGIEGSASIGVSAGGQATMLSTYRSVSSDLYSSSSDSTR